MRFDYTYPLYRRVPGGARKNRLRLACGTYMWPTIRAAIVFYGNSGRPTVVAPTSESYVFDYRQRGLQCCPAIYGVMNRYE